MKRSTLTLSILTALLVSACGGSSSNDEQTKDPTPPKVTPTKPTTPSTGNTSTTGNTGNAGNSGSSAGSSSSASSSDPTPPISSGSAPSGGKPIVIDGGKQKEEEKTPGGEEPTDPPVDPLKEALDKAKQELKAIDEQKEDKERALNLLVQIDKTTKKPTEGIVPTKWKEQNKLREKLLKDLGFTGDDLTNLDIETIKQKIASDPTKYADQSDDLKKYEELRADWLESKAEMLKLRAEVQALGQQSVDKQKEVKTLEYKQKIENAEVKSEREYLTKKEQKEQFDLDKEKADAESTALAKNLDQKKIEKGILEKQQKDLEKAIALAKASKKDHAALEKQLKQVEAGLEQNEKDQDELTRNKNAADDAAKTAKANSDSIKNEVEKLKKIAQNRGVIGSTGLSDKDFLEIDTAKLTSDKKTWVLELKNGAKVKITTDPKPQNKVEYKADDTTKKTAYGYFGEYKGQDIAFNPSGSNAETSIYGYVGDQFYSVGKVAGAEAMKKLEATPNAQYKGKALLKADPAKVGEGKHGDLVADVVVNLNLTQNKLDGNFSNFATYKRGDNAVEATAVNGATNNTNVSEDLKAALKSPVKFNASIKGNKFATSADDKSQASVYGYFYGDDAEEVGGLVEYQDVFHGSFGGKATK